MTFNQFLWIVALNIFTWTPFALILAALVYWAVRKAIEVGFRAALSAVLAANTMEPSGDLELRGVRERYYHPSTEKVSAGK